MRYCVARIIRAVARFEPVSLVIRRRDCNDLFRYFTDQRYINTADFLEQNPKITLLQAELDDAWLRDSGPSFVFHGEQLAGINWRFNAWGGKYPDFANDDAVAKTILHDQSAEAIDVPLIMEGGSFHVDGNGTLLTTEQCLLHPNRNNLPIGELEQAFADYLGVRKIIWLRGDPLDTETDGHIDEIACFSRAGRVIATDADTDAADRREVLRENLEILRSSVDADGNSITVTTIPCPSVYYKGARRIASYVNFYIANGGIIMPGFDVDTDDTAYRILCGEFPDREVVQVDIPDLTVAGGGIHCITQQQPSIEDMRSRS